MPDPWPIVRLTDFDRRVRDRLERGFSRYDFRFCGDEDWEALRSFLRDHWGGNHPYVVSPLLVRWQLYDAVSGRYNFLIAVQRETGHIHGCAAFVLTSQFDPAIPVRDVWPGLWRAHPDAVPGLGAEIMLRLIEALRPRSGGVMGLSRKAVQVLPRLGWTLGVMDHHYLLNPDLKDYRLVGGAELAPASIDTESFAHRRLRELSEVELRSIQIPDFDPLAHVPAKSYTFLINRYAAHPFYSYRLYAVEDDQRTLGVLVTRTVEAEGARAVRLVDYLGHDEGWIGLGPALTSLVREEGAEYADLYSAGLDPGFLRRAGMTRHEADDPVVIPNYFEPFEKRNKALDYGYVIPPGTTYRMFKADSDQDRPNLL